MGYTIYSTLCFVIFKFKTEDDRSFCRNMFSNLKSVVLFLRISIYQSLERVHLLNNCHGHHKKGFIFKIIVMVAGNKNINTESLLGKYNS